MALLGINPVHPNESRKPTTLEQIALGVKMATEILGTGIQGYRAYKEGQQNDAQNELYRAQAADMPGYKDLQRQHMQSEIDLNKAMMPTKQAAASLGIQKDTLDVQSKKLGLAKAADEAQYGAKATHQDVQPLTDLKLSMSSAVEMQKMIDDLQKKGYDTSKLFGYLDSRISNSELLQNIADPDQKRFAALANRFFNEYRRYVTGAGASTLELENLKAAIPSQSDANPDLFGMKVKDYLNQAVRNYGTELDSLKNRQIDVRKFDLPESGKIMQWLKGDKFKDLDFSHMNKPASQNSDALEWLKLNPNDPRAPAIKRKLGM